MDFLPSAWILLVGLPSCRPLDQLLPAPALMLRAKARDASQFLVLRLDRQVRVAHETLPQEIDAVSNMHRRGHYGEIMLVELRALHDGIVQDPEALPNSVLSFPTVNRNPAAVYPRTYIPDSAAGGRQQRPISPGRWLDA